MAARKVDWALYKDQLLDLKYNQNKSLTQISRILYDKLGVSITNARLSQVFTEWAKQQNNNKAEEQPIAN